MRKERVSIIYEITYVEYCLLQQYSETWWHIEVDIRNMCWFAPILSTVTYAFFFLFWELGSTQGHVSLKGIQFTFCSRTCSNFIRALIDSRWSLVHFPLAIHYESWPCCKGEWKAARGVVCKSTLLRAIGNCSGAPSNYVSVWKQGHRKTSNPSSMRPKPSTEVSVPRWHMVEMEHSAGNRDIWHCHYLCDLGKTIEPLCLNRATTIKANK